MTRERAIGILLLSFILCLYLYRLVLITNISVRDEEIYEEKNKIHDLSIQNNILEIKFLQLTAFKYIDKKARERGLEDVKKYVTPTIAIKTYTKR